MAESEGLFGTYKQCEYCRRPLPNHYDGTYCPKCMDTMLFREVKEFIRTNVVNEYQVAEHFGISLKQVKNWIKEGRIEYVMDDPAKNITTMHCQRCGAPVSFGTLCGKCLKLMNGDKGYSNVPVDTDTKMRYLDSK